MDTRTDSTGRQASPLWGTAALAVLGAVLLWISQPPLKWWPAAWFALVPWLYLAASRDLNRRGYAAFYLVAFGYWALTMQGLRHAHPAMFAAWLALAAYLAVYPVLWIAALRVSRFPLWLAAPVFWIGLEWVRNYFATGISAVMLGHTQADVAAMIQIADLFGSYGVGFVVALVNAAVAGLLISQPRLGGAAAQVGRRQAIIGAAVAAAAVVLTFVYGSWRLSEIDSAPPRDSIGVALIGRDEPIVFEQDSQRELEIFDAYFNESVRAAERAAETGFELDAVVWPESMFTGGLPWLSADPSRPIEVPEGFDLSAAELQEIVAERQGYFERRAGQVQYSLARGRSPDEANEPPAVRVPDLIVGCSIGSYNPPAGGHSGCVHVREGRVVDWYAKNHLVMFGEYIPLINYLPWIHQVVPSGMGIVPGDGPVAMRVGETFVAPNVCIETAVERVPLRHVRELAGQGRSPDVIINVTNDGWFNRTSIVEHHLRCSQLVAVGCRRPVLIAANGGPTAWIDSSGRIVEKLAFAEAGFILARPQRDGRSGLYQRIGDLPAAATGVITLGVLGFGIIGRRRKRRMPAAGG